MRTRLAAIPDGPFKTQGIAAGNAAADAMIAAREGDGRFGPSPWKSNKAPGHWQPQLNPDGTPILDPTPWVGGVRPFLIESSSQFRTPGPHALPVPPGPGLQRGQSARLGEQHGPHARPEHIAPGGRATPGRSWNAVARDLVNAGYGVELADTALLFAQLNLSGADAAISCWNDKYYWDFWRPWQAIHEAAGTAIPRPSLTRRGRRSSPRPTPSTRPGHLSLDGAHPRCCRCSSAPTSEGAST